MNLKCKIIGHKWETVYHAYFDSDSSHNVLLKCKRCGYLHQVAYEF